jgi:drug/metabolite transporter (DMT)-like permease
VSPRLLGVLLAVTSAASFGVMPVLTKVAYDDGADVRGVLSVRFALASVVLLALALLRKEPLARGRQLVTLLLLGGVGYVFEASAYFAALTRISAGLTALLLYLYPAIVVVLVAVMTRARPTTRAMVCVAVATLGTGLTIGPVGGGQVTGVLLGLTAALSYSGYVVISSRVVAPGAPFATAAVVMGGAAVVYGTGALTLGASLPSSPGAWTALLAVALVCTVLAVSTFFAALPRLGAPDLAVLSTIEPVVSVAVGAIALGESLGPVQLAGGVLVLGAVGVLARTPAPHLPLDAP